MYLTDWQSGRHPDSVWFALKDRPMTFWNWLVCQGPHIGKLPCWGMYQGTHWTLVRALKNNNFKNFHSIARRRTNKSEILQKDHWKSGHLNPEIIFHYLYFYCVLQVLHSCKLNGINLCINFPWTLVHIWLAITTHQIWTVIH